LRFQPVLPLSVFAASGSEPKKINHVGHRAASEKKSLSPRSSAREARETKKNPVRSKTTFA